MRVLHLLSDWRWTGPADPVVNLVSALREKGCDAILACRKPPQPASQSVEQKAIERGLKPEVRFHLNRYFHPKDVLEDLFRLPRHLEQEQIDILHTHLSHDHILGGLAARRSRRPVIVIRTNHKGVPLERSRGRAWLLSRYSDAYLGFSRAAAQEDRRTFDLPDDRVFVVNPAVDLARFDPSRPYDDVRKDYGLGSEHVLGGIVARVQRHRRFHVLLEAVRLAVAEAPNLRLLIIGRGTHIQTVAKDPVKAMGLEKVVLFSGYRSGDYVDHVRSLDFKVFLVPGSDGTCRAVREAMALEKPVLAARRGMLPELVLHEKAGLIVEDTPENLAAAMVRLAGDPDLRRRLGEGARQHALQHFRIEDQADGVIEMYKKLAGKT